MNPLSLLRHALMDAPVFRLLAVLAGLFLAPVLHAQVTYSLTNPAITGYPASGPMFIIDSDRSPGASPPGVAPANRWYINAGATITAVSTASFTTPLAVRCRLVDSTGAVVPCEGAASDGYVTGAYSTLSALGSGTRTTTRLAYLIPLASSPLSSSLSYKIQVQAIPNGRSVPFATGESALTYRFARFSGPAGPDPAVNVVGRFGNGSGYAHTFAVKTDPATQDFSLSIPYTLYRYDEPTTPTGPNTSSPVSIHFTVSLYDSAAPDVPISLANPDTTLSVVTAIHDTVNLIYASPSSVSDFALLKFRPADGIQLDSPGKTYFARVALHHTEDPADLFPKVDDTVTLAAQRLLHFNGALIFGQSTANPIATTFTSVTNNPSLGALLTPTSVDTTIGVGAGSLNGPGHTFTGPALSVSLLANGNAIIRGASSVTLTPPSLPDRGSTSGVRYDRSGIVLNAAGATAGGLATILPAGMGWQALSTGKTLTGRIALSSVLLNQSLQPVAATLPWTPPGGSAWVMEESKPVLIHTSALTWTTTSGNFALTAADQNAAYVRAAELTLLEASPVAAALKLKSSNEQYWRFALNTAPASIRAGSQGGAEFSGGFTITPPAPQAFRTHFPYGASMQISGGAITVTADFVVPASSTLTLPAANPTISMRWLNGCKDPNCDAPVALPTTLQNFTPDSRTLRVTQDGGLVASGTFASGLNLHWGFIPSLNKYAHSVATPFTTGTFAMGGISLKGSASPTGLATDGPGILLYTGVSVTTGLAAERPSTNTYLNGQAEYAGYNVRLGANDATDSGVSGLTTLTGKPYGPYALKKRCKYYVRGGGVTGIHDKVPSAPDHMELYGYDVTLTNFGLAFLDNGVLHSRVNGRILVPDPSDIYADFAEMRFFCNGGLDTALIADSTPPQILAHWGAPIDILAMQFVHPEKCAVSEGYLTLGLYSYVSHLIDTLSGTVGFLANGNLINKEFSDLKQGELAGLDSRFRMPSQVRFQGPKRQTTEGGYEEYILTPSTGAFLNVSGTGPAWDQPDNADPDGFWNIAGRLKVSFFEAPTIHFQTTANRPPPPAVIDDPKTWTSLELAWQNAVMKIANGAWKTNGVLVTSFFDPGFYHDAGNRGIPLPGAGESPAEIRHFYTTDPQYMAKTQQSWLGGALHFRYKLQWNSVTRSFTSLTATESEDDSALKKLADDMVFIKTEHRLPYLSAERAELTFGASYDGIPKVHAANFILNELDDLTGIFQTATEAGCGEIFKALDSGLNSLAKLLNDQSRDLFTDALSPVIHPLSADIYQKLTTDWNQGAWAPANALAPRLATFRSKLQDALNGVSSTSNALQEIAGYLHTTHLGLDRMINPQDGFLALNEAGQIEIARNLAKNLVQLLSKEISGTTIALGKDLVTAIAAKLDPLLADAQPTLLDIREILQQLDSVVVEVEKAVLTGGAIAQEIADSVNSALSGSELDTLTAGVNSELTAWLGTFQKSPGGKNFLGLTEEKIRLKIETAIYDRFFGTRLIAKIQSVIKQHLQDIEGSIRSGIDSIFAQVNEVVKNALSQLLSEVDDTINGMLGTVGKYLGSGSIVGQATFNGDALRRLRMDGELEFKVSDSVHLSGFLEINQYTSKDTPPGCLNPQDGETITEAVVGANHVNFDFISPGVKVNLSGKFTFRTDASDKISLVGLGAGIEMVEGTINFEAFQITKLGLGVAFGEEENYFSAGMGMKMGSWGGNGGIFFGRTCSLQPIMLWDPFAAKALGDPATSFSGFYVYGEVHVPVAEVILGIPDTCFFSLTADAGVGFFFFEEGPTFGARMGLGIDGQVLCLLGISGRLDLLGGKFGGLIKLTGKGEVCAKLLFVDVCKDITISTTVGSDGKMQGSGNAD